MTYKKTNLNYYFKVKLTEKGIDILKQRYGTDYQIDIDDEGYTEIQMWDFTRLFGKYMGMGLDPVCHTNIMVQVEDEKNKTEVVQKENSENVVSDKKYYVNSSGNDIGVDEYESEHTVFSGTKKECEEYIINLYGC